MMRRLVTIGGETLSEAAWARRIGCTRAAISYRRKKFGETSEQAITALKEHMIYRRCPDKERIRILQKVWEVYEEWLRYDATGDGVYKDFVQWLHSEYEKARKPRNNQEEK